MRIKSALTVEVLPMRIKPVLTALVLDLCFENLLITCFCTFVGLHFFCTAGSMKHAAKESDNMEKILFQRGSFIIKLSTIADSKIVDLLADTLWGTPGKLQYRQKNLHTYLPLNQNTHWISVYRGEQILGVFVLLKRMIHIGKQSIAAYHIRYLAAAASLLIGSAKSAGENDKKQRKSPIRDAFMQIFEDPAVIDPDYIPGTAAVYYAYVEGENVRSMQMTADFGLSPSRVFSALPFSRFSPKKHPLVSAPENHELEFIKSRLLEKYSQFGFFFADHLFYEGEYLVYREAEKIVAGVKIIQQNWILESMPGISGKLLLNVLPKIPVASKILDPKDFKFLLFDHFFSSPGFEHCLYPLLETALSLHRVNMGLIWADRESPLAKMVLADNKLGFIAKIKSAANATLITRYHHCDDEMVQFLKERPVYLSSFDMA
jgi:hypothetical protein